MDMLFLPLLKALIHSSPFHPLTARSLLFALLYISLETASYTVVPSEPHSHDGSQAYFGTASVGTTETTYVELTLKKVNQLPIWSE